VRNARQALEERLQDESAFRATFDGVGRTAPADYLIDGVKVQSKFINGINNNLAHVLKHMEDYPDFTQDKAFYHIPKDTWQTIQDVIDGKPVEGMNERSLQAIREKVAEIKTQPVDHLRTLYVQETLIIKMSSGGKSMKHSINMTRN
jgi:hypothetical protein